MVNQHSSGALSISSLDGRWGGGAGSDAFFVLCSSQWGAHVSARAYHESNRDRSSLEVDGRDVSTYIIALRTVVRGRSSMFTGESACFSSSLENQFLKKKNRSDSDDTVQKKAGLLVRLQR